MLRLMPIWADKSAVGAVNRPLQEIRSIHPVSNGGDIMTTRSPTKDVSQQEQRIFSFDWYRTLPEQAAHAFWASAMGWALDAFDFQVFSLALTAIAATFALSKGQSGLIATVTLVVSAIGGVAAGALADRIGRVRTLMVTIAVYAIFTFLSGLAPN